MIAERFSLRKEYRARTLFVIGNTVFLLISALFILIPMLRVIADSLDENAAVGILRLIPEDWTITAYKLILSQKALYRPFLISLFVTTTGTLLALSLTTMLAYGLIQKGLPGRKLFVYLILITMLFRAGLIPTYMMIRSLGILDTLLPVLLGPCVNVFYFILMMNFFRTIPRDFAEAAEAEGAGELQIFLRIILPLAKPGLAAIGLFYAVMYWNDFFSYIIYINNSKLWNFQVILRDMVLESETSMPRLDASQTAPESLKNAVIIVAIIPVGILYPFLQKYFVKGINLGGIKG
jgi:putative aldouronate transport system permease protein